MFFCYCCICPFYNTLHKYKTGNVKIEVLYCNINRIKNSISPAQYSCKPAIQQGAAYVHNPKKTKKVIRKYEI